MKRLTILVPQGENNLSSIVGPYKIFSRANDYRESKGKKPVFTIELAGLSKCTDFYGGLFSVHPHCSIHSVKNTDLIIVPSLNHQYEKAIGENGPMIDWLQAQYHKGAAVASICTGAFMLAAAGLLSGKSCSTHWAAADRLRELFPEVNLVPDKLITDEDRICTNGGAYSFLNLIVYLVEKYYDRETAIFCAKIFQIDIDRQSQSAFAIFSRQKNHGDEVIKKAQRYIEENLAEKISVEEMSSRYCIGRRHFDRRFFSATGNTPLEYTQRVRIETAKKAFENSRKNINEVMYEVGYNDSKAFREVFRKITGMSPLEYRKRFGRVASGH